MNEINSFRCYKTSQLRMIKIISCLILTILIINSAKSQTYKLSLDTLNKYVNQHSESNTDKVKEIYFIIADNVKYDVAKLSNQTAIDTVKPSDKVKEVLKNGLGVCIHYAQLFDTLCKMNNISSFVVSGYTKNIDGKIAQTGHAWNVVELDNKYYLVDVTWGAGYVDNDKFFKRYDDKYLLTLPNEFAKTHMPCDPIWQLSTNPINNYEFEMGDLSKFSEENTFNFEDSIRLYVQSDLRTQIKGKKRRLEKNGITKNLTSSELNQCNTWLIYDEFNLSVDTFNEGIHLFNQYVNWKHKYFRKPKRTDEEIKEKFYNAAANLNQSFEKISSCVPPNSELKEAKENFLSQQSQLINKLEKEKNFVNDYLSTKKFFRAFIWYKSY